MKNKTYRFQNFDDQLWFITISAKSYNEASQMCGPMWRLFSVTKNA